MTAADGGRRAADGDEPGETDAAVDASDATTSMAMSERAAPSADEVSNMAKQRALSALCDGSPGITFSALSAGGGNQEPATRVMTENGYNFLIIEGDCQYWALDGLLSHVTTGKLSEADRQGVVEAFHLDQWALNTGASASGPVDGPTIFMLFGRELNALDCTAEPAADGCKSISASKLTEFPTLRSDYAKKRDELYDSGKPLTGDVRYVLVADAESLIFDWNKPGSWPLGDPTKVAMTKQDVENYKPGQSQHARGDDARALQDLWRKFLDGEISGHERGALGIPIEVDGKRYALFLRDSIPLENDRGLILF